LRIFGFEIKKAAPQASFRSQLRPSDGQGPYTSFFQKWVPRKVETEFYEVLREAIPIIDAAIWKLVALDGHLVVKGRNEALVEEIKDWMENVQVNDLQKGLQAFHQNMTNEAFEQGFGLGERVLLKGLPRKPGLDRHHQNHVETFSDINDARERGAGTQGEPGGGAQGSNVRSQGHRLLR